MKIGVLRETSSGERRVAIIPETVKKLGAKKIDFIVQSGAGANAFFADADYEAAGARLADSADEVMTAADVIVKVQAAQMAEINKMKEGSTLLSLLYPFVNGPLIQALLKRRITSIALDMIPRTTLAQAMDVLSSQANIAGYYAVIAAAAKLPRFFPMLMTAAGTITPARVLIMGVGVAGLQAIGTAKRLGAIVEATDVRRETKEQVESLGGRFIEVTGVEIKSGTGGYAAEQSDEYKKKQAELISEHIAKADVVITTALIPGRKAPILVTDAQVKRMRPGSVIVDLAAEQGGNVEGNEAGREVVRHGATIIGLVNAAANLSYHASQTFSRNLEKLLVHMTADGQWKMDLNEEITKGCVITRNGEVVHAKVKESFGGAA